MSHSFDKLNKTFNIPSEEERLMIKTSNELENVEIINPELLSEDDDFEIARLHLRNLIKKSSQTLNEVLDMASESGAPRAYEVAGQILKNSSDISEKLMNLHKTKKDMNKESGDINNYKVTNNSLFVGSSNDLFNALKSQNIIKDNK